MGSRNYTRELRRAKEQGAKIVCSMAPFEGVEVTYSPRAKGDPQPWVPEQTRHTGRMADVEYRYSGRECHAVMTVRTAHQNPATGETRRYEIDVKADGVSTGRVSGTVVAVRSAERRSPASGTETPSTT